MIAFLYTFFGWRIVMVFFYQDENSEADQQNSMLYIRKDTLSFLPFYGRCIITLRNWISELFEFELMMAVPGLSGSVEWI